MSEAPAKLTFLVEMAEMRKAVNFTRNALGNSKTDLGVMLIRVSGDGQFLRLFATDKEIYAVSAIKTVGPGSTGSFAVMGNKLEKLVSQVDAENVIFNVDKENCEVKAGFLTVNFEVYDDSQLAVVQKGLGAEAPDGEEALAVLKGALEEALVCAKSCTTANSIRPDVNHAEFREGRLLSSDGRKIMVYVHNAVPVGMHFKVPAVALNGIIGCVKNAETESLLYKEGKSYFHLKFGTGGWSCGVRKIERTFPRVEEMILQTEAPDDEITIDKLMLESMVKGVALGLSSDEVKVNMTVAGVGTESTLQVSAVNQVGRKSYESSSCGRKGNTNITFPVSYKHLVDTLGVFKGDSIVDMQMLNKRSILLVRDTTDQRQVLTVIPFRTAQVEEAEKKEEEAAKKAEEKKDEKKPGAEQPETAAAAVAAA